VEPLPPAAAETPATPRKRRPPWLAIGFAVVALASGGIGFGLGRASGPDLLRSNDSTPAAPSTSRPRDVFTITGTMTVLGRCGSGGYTDIELGSQVEIVNQDNKVLAVTNLQAGSGGACSFKFTVIGVPAGERLYGAKIGNANRGVIWHSEQEAKLEGFHLTLG
jgi:hypothetical protein